jgi:hypothetical protein
MLAGTIANRVVLDRAASRHRERSAIAPEGLCGRTAVGVTGLIVAEIIAREGAVAALRFVVNRDVRLDPAIMHEPVQHLGRAVGGVADQALGI